MANDPRKKVAKIHGQINKIAQKGKDYVIDFHKLVDDIVSKGDYAYLEMCLSHHYNLDAAKYKTVHDIKSKTWKHILFETEASFITGLKRIYNSNNVYQQGQEIRSEKSDYTALAVIGGIDHLPFKEEKASVSEEWNKRFERSKYVPVEADSQISITKDGSQPSGIRISIIDAMIYQIDVAKVIWATYSVMGTQSNYIIESPHEVSILDTIRPIGTQSHLDQNSIYRTNIPTTHGGDYMVKAYRRGTPGWLSPELSHEIYSYKVYVRKENLLGTIKEVEHYEAGSEYLQMNSNFAELTGLKKTFLEVMKAGYPNPVTIVYDNSAMSEERNLLERYKIAIGYLNS